MRRKDPTVIVILAATACIAPATLHAALASAAGTLFEAAPFVLVATWGGRLVGGLRLGGGGPRPCGWVRRHSAGLIDWCVALLGCGCGRLPGALSLPAVALCWLAFGPAVALARCAAALLLTLTPLARSPREAWRLDSGGCGSRPPQDEDPQALLASLVLPALGAALAAQTLIGGVQLAPWMALAAGALAGALSPCAAGSVAMAAALRQCCPAAAAGLLATAGLFLPWAPSRESPAARASHAEQAAFARLAGAAPATRLASAALALACALLVARHGAGFISPRLVPLVALGAALAAALALWPPASEPAIRLPSAGRTAWAAPAVLIAALVMGSPQPATPVASATNLEAAFPGEALHVVGAAQGDGSGTTLVRFAITCCRADAAPVAVRLDRHVAVADGEWVEADGLLVEGALGLQLRVSKARRVAAPGDPFVYR